MEPKDAATIVNKLSGGQMSGCCVHTTPTIKLVMTSRPLKKFKIMVHINTTDTDMLVLTIATVRAL